MTEIGVGEIGIVLKEDASFDRAVFPSMPFNAHVSDGHLLLLAIITHMKDPDWIASMISTVCENPHKH